MEGSTSINNIESINNINGMSEKNDINSIINKQSSISNKNTINFSQYEIKDNCLIIRGNKFSAEINKQLEELFFETTYDDTEINNKNKDIYSPYEHILFTSNERKKKKKTY